ncbi:phage tail tip lysozyme [Tardiphaga sp. 367_B4_N1_1]|uniref:phage tail tip lysozyme n=1 Tax=Tardiphaga sp. 367_B4_N1_1 TaxID=3240777 RepID=UPI003F291711
MNGNSSLVGSWLNFAQQPADQGGLGLAPHQAAGLVGNLVNESGQNLPAWGPTGDNGTAWGTAQWRGPRLAALKNMFPDNYQSPEAQMQFMRHEMMGPENKAYRALMAATTPEEAATAVNQHYERSADTTGNREKAARQLMAQFGGAGGGTGALAFSPEEDEGGSTGSTGGALSANSALGTGALQTLMPGVEGAGESKGGKHKWSSALTGMAAALASISSPQQAYALSALSKQLKDGDADEAPTYKISVGKDGRIIRVNPKTGAVDAIGGNPAGPAQPQMLGDVSKTGGDYLKTLDPVTQKIINSWHDGTGVAPSGYQLKNPQVQQQIAAAQQAFPDMDFQKLPERNTFVKDMAKTNPASIGGQISTSLASLKHMGNLAQSYLDLNNSNGGGITQAAHGMNYLKDTFGGTDRSAHAAALDTHGGLASGEITKFITGTGGGVHEREERKKKLANSHYSPEEAAGVLEAQRQDLKEKHEVLVEKAKNTMGESWLAKHPEIAQQYDELDSGLRDRIAQLKSNGHTAQKSAAPSALPKGVTSIKVIQP